jgi:8-amino-7-oxononanoate synthase
MPLKSRHGLVGQVRDKLIQQALERKLRRIDQTDTISPAVADPSAGLSDDLIRFEKHPGYQQLRIIEQGSARLGIANPFFKQHAGAAGATTRIDGRELINFASYNYLGLSGHPAVIQAAKDAIDHYGVSVSASRIVSGERPVHSQLEQALARAYGVDDALVLVSGHATNVTTIGYLFGSKDLIVHDAFSHNSIVQGAQLAGSKRLSFPHNDWAALDALLDANRRQYERVLIVLEGIYSMDGDYPELPRFIDIKRRHKAYLMVDEAHSFGVMGPTGKGIREHFSIAGNEVDIWMGTLSKTLAGCGGFIAGETALVKQLRYLAPGFLYSVGMPPVLAAASLAALTCMQREPERIARLQANGRLFLELAQAAGIDTGASRGLGVIPAITGSSIKAARLAAALFERGINVQPIVYPAVQEKAARLRFFMSSEHDESQLRQTVEFLAHEAGRL